MAAKHGYRLIGGRYKTMPVEREGYYYWGSQQFAERILNADHAAIKKSRSRGYPERRAHGEREALRLLAEGMKAAGLDAVELGRLKGSDPRKVAIARLIRQRTTVSLVWIAERLSMRSAADTSRPRHSY
jgi:hypothetical protein